MKHQPFREIYASRKMALGFPDLESLGVNDYSLKQGEKSKMAQLITCVERLTGFSSGLRTVAVIGCGPKAVGIPELLALGLDAVGVEPVKDYVKSAERYIGAPDRVRLGTAESLPFANQSQAIVIMEHVLEHVDSPVNSLAEIDRVLIPGGVAYIATSNRYHFSPTGYNGEFRVPFYNLFPRIVKESYVHHHLHFQPSLANYTPRPAVHWFCYSDLCALGRTVGFHQFYNKLDLLRPDDPVIAKSWVRKTSLGMIQFCPWVRSLALLQFGNNIFMLKRTVL